MMMNPEAMRDMSLNKPPPAVYEEMKHEGVPMVQAPPPCLHPSLNRQQLYYSPMTTARSGTGAGTGREEGQGFSL